MSAAREFAAHFGGKSFFNAQIIRTPLLVKARLRERFLMPMTFIRTRPNGVITAD